MMMNLMTILVKKVFISSKPTFVYLLCPPLCGPFSIQESAAGGLSYKEKKSVCTTLLNHLLVQMIVYCIWYFAATLKRPNILYLDNFFRNSEGSSPNSFLNTSENLLGLSYPILAAISVMLSEVSRSKIVAACIR